jgi:hypothetical protein
MSKLTMSPRFCYAPLIPRQFGLRIWLLASSILMSISVPARAIQKDVVWIPVESSFLQQDRIEAVNNIDPYRLQSNSSSLEQENYVEVIRAIQDYPEVVVFPIQVAGPITVSATRRLANKIAQLRPKAASP